MNYFDHKQTLGESKITSTSTSTFTFAARAICAGICLLSLNVYAEKADSQKKTKVDAEYSSYDGKTDTKVLKGNVEVTRGTLQIKAEAAIDKETPDGGGSVTLTGGSGRQVFFRQKRDGGADLWIEGYADRVEYDKKTEVVKFLANAKVRYLNQQKVTQEQAAEFFSYDSINDVFEATNSSTGKRIPGGGRVTITSEPKEKKQDK
ncbi:lipopolysaccharide transport periplasmic protein LptA [Undibacterium flavidum]|uniref:Lipopolysaccharide transport periplasmic protein LptA n=1 Tax=Undibacterium flavidum TaxID=2762297 RepID=A0ABR6YCE5_9BURK|nr:lipopolysaccharide transport periplasmic protein LptA [Undibacterium flavidum]MBC3874213.1 lipopolysaccharide transport periplasmic protein LptA [Undibacterium flavidum]